jgi:hypothetical protein
MPTRLDKYSFKRVHGDTVVGTVTGGMGIVVAVPVTVLVAPVQGAVFGHEGVDVVAVFEKGCGEAVLSFDYNTISIDIIIRGGGRERRGGVSKIGSKRREKDDRVRTKGGK